MGFLEPHVRHRGAVWVALKKVAKTLDDFARKGKKVVLRADLNVPVQNGKISDIWG
jgi:hypothetical protein